MNKKPPRFTGTANDLTPADLALVLSGGVLRPGAALILPSGREITAEQWAQCGGRSA